MSLRNPMHGKIEIDTSCLPDPGKSEMDFLDSSFFSINPGRRLPHPVEVTSRSQDWKTSPNPITVRFEEMNLLVKFGPRVKTEEALNLRVIKKHLPDTVPVPEVYGWKIEGSCVFIYMELIRGESLHDRWDSLEASDKESLCHQLREIVSSIRQIEPGSGDSLIGIYDFTGISNITDQYEQDH